LDISPTTVTVGVEGFIMQDKFRAEGELPWKMEKGPMRAGWVLWCCGARK